jgi:hypothetical protein
LAKKVYSRKEHTKISKLGKVLLRNVVKCGKCIALQNSQILYTFVLRAEIATTFGPKMIAISARNTKVYKICKLCKAITSAFYNISQPNFAILLILVVDLFASP